MIYHSIQSDESLLYLILRGKKRKKLKHPNTKYNPPYCEFTTLWPISQLGMGSRNGKASFFPIQEIKRNKNK